MLSIQSTSNSRTSIASLRMPSRREVFAFRFTVRCFLPCSPFGGWGGIAPAASAQIFSHSRFLRLLRNIEGERHGVLADGLDVFLLQVGISLLDDLTHPDLGEFLGDEFSIEKTSLCCLLILHERGDYLVEVFLADALALGRLRLGNAFDLDVEQAGSFRRSRNSSWSFW